MFAIRRFFLADSFKINKISSKNIATKNRTYQKHIKKNTKNMSNRLLVYILKIIVLKIQKLSCLLNPNNLGS